MVGTVRSWDPKCGFGFIRIGHGVEDLFFHRGSVRSPIRRGDEVNFAIGDSTGRVPGWVAVDIEARPGV